MSNLFSAIDAAKRAVQTESEGLVSLLRAIDGPLGTSIVGAITLLQKARGRIIVTGMGKSGHIGRKIAATLASTGTPASFVHPAEASHGDLGMITTHDAVLMLSNSGESAELKDILNYCARFSVPMIAITANAESTLARAADIVLQLPSVKEACPNGLAPTSSTLLQLALGDALAMALLEARGFSATDFRSFHPGGKLGARIKHAHDIMHKPAELPLLPQSASVMEAVKEISHKKFGCVGITNEKGQLCGMITDGDLRRHFGPDIATKSATDIMTGNPTTISANMLAAEVIELINNRSITSVFVVDSDGSPVGLVHIHDLLREGVS